MKGLILLIICLFTLTPLRSQVVPEDLYGAEFRAWVKQTWYDGEFSPLTYSDARKMMFAYVVNRNDSIECVYSGLKQAHPYGLEISFPDPFNTEHVVPQSVFSSQEPMKSDIHILQPAYDDWNTLRSNNPYTEINDNQTTQWIYMLSSTGSIPSSNIDLYSEYKPFYFEPRESRKGDIARAVMYFFTMYPSYDINMVIDTSILCVWHETDLPDTYEELRSDLTEDYQGNINPYIEYPWLANQAWGCDVEVPPSTGVMDVKADVGTYPNPSRGEVNLHIGNFSDFPVRAVFMDLSGRNIREYGIKGQDSILKTSGLTGEVYILIYDRAGHLVGHDKVILLGQ